MALKPLDPTLAPTWGGDPNTLPGAKANISPQIRSAAEGLVPGTQAGVAGLSSAETSAYPALAKYVQNLSTPWGQQGLVDSARSQLQSQAQGQGTAASNLAAMNQEGQGAQDAARTAALNRANETANQVQATYATPQGQAGAAQGISSIVQGMGAIPSLNDQLAIRANENSTPQSNTPTFLQSVVGPLIGAAGTIGGAAVGK